MLQGTVASATSPSLYKVDGWERTELTFDLYRTIIHSLDRTLELLFLSEQEPRVTNPTSQWMENLFALKKMRVLTVPSTVKTDTASLRTPCTVTSAPTTAFGSHRTPQRDPTVPVSAAGSVASNTQQGLCMYQLLSLSLFSQWTESLTTDSSPLRCCSKHQGVKTWTWSRSSRESSTLNLEEWWETQN